MSVQHRKVDEGNTHLLELVGAVLEDLLIVVVEVDRDGVFKAFRRGGLRAEVEEIFVEASPGAAAFGTAVLPIVLPLLLLLLLLLLLGLLLPGGRSLRRVRVLRGDGGSGDGGSGSIRPGRWARGGGRDGDGDGDGAGSGRGGLGPSPFPFLRREDLLTVPKNHRAEPALVLLAPLGVLLDLHQCVQGGLQVGRGGSGHVCRGGGFRGKVGKRREGLVLGDFLVKGRREVATRSQAGGDGREERRSGRRSGPRG